GVAGPERRARKRIGFAKATAAQDRLPALVERGIAAVVVDALTGTAPYFVPCLPCVDAVTMMRPPPFLTKCGATARMALQVPVRLTSMVSCQSASCQSRIALKA